MAVAVQGTRDVPIKDLTRYPGNPRRGNTEEIRASVRRLGQYRTIVVRDTGDALVILAGNHTTAALEAEGHTSVRAEVIECSDDEARRINLADNRLAELGGYDDDDLAAMLADLGGDFDGTGWGQDDLDALLGSDGDGGKNDPDDVPEPPAEPVTQPGDVWRLGPHRLLCGNSTKADDVARLLGDVRPQLVMTSPPYWIGFTYENEKDWPAVLLFIRDVSALLAVQTAADGRIIINTGTVQGGELTGQGAHMRLLIDEWQRALDANGWLMRYVRFWVKDGGLGMIAPSMDVIDQHTEFLGYFYKRGKHKFRGQERLTGEPWALKGYWSDIPGEARKHDHVASYPVELAARNIRLHSRPGEVVWEPFGGSGSTLIAAHDLSRVCYAMELDQRYCDVIVQRFQEHTGIEPERIT